MPRFTASVLAWVALWATLASFMLAIWTHMPEFAGSGFVLTLATFVLFISANWSDF